MLSTATSSCHRKINRPVALNLESFSNRVQHSFPPDRDTTASNGQTWKDVGASPLSPVTPPRQNTDSDWATSPMSDRSSNRAYFEDNALGEDPSHDYMIDSGRERITVNVSGERYQTYADTLARFPGTLLGDPCKRGLYYCCSENEYFFDRDRHAFNAILYFYQSGGQLYCPVTIPMNILVSEAKFFELGNDALKQVLDMEEVAQSELPNNKIQREVWKLFEHPDSSKAANILTLFSVAVIILSVGILCTETLPQFKKNKTIQVDGTRIIQSPINGSNITINTTRTVNDGFPWKTFFDHAEVIFVAWFTLEFTTRFLSSPNKCDFLKNMMNLIDILSIAPYYITTAVQLQGNGLSNFRIFRLVRVFRIFKLSRHSRGLQILGLTLKASMRELGLLIFFLMIGVILFSSAVYYVEANAFESIPDAFWWAIVTMCTVGYGDKVPHTFFGKLVGSACAVSGVLTIALPVPVIVSNFDYFYNRERTRKMHQDVCAHTDLDLGKSDRESSADDERSIGTQSPGSTSQNERESPSRSMLIQRQSELRKLESNQRKLSQRLTELSQNPQGLQKANGRDSGCHSNTLPTIILPHNGETQHCMMGMDRESCL